MELSTLLRKVKRQFGDEYDMLINNQDIYDWLNAGQVDIVRNTSAMDVTLPVVANTFPVTIADQVAIKRVTYQNKALAQTNYQELDASGLDTTTEGVPLYWYYESGKIGLYPTPKSTDTYNILVTYSKIPQELHLLAPWLQFTTVQTSVQYASWPTDVSFNGTDLNVVLDVYLDRPQVTSYFATRGTGNAAATLCWLISHVGGTNNINLSISNGTTLESGVVPFLASVQTPGNRVKFRVKYVGSTGIFTLYRIDTDTGVETIQGTQNSYGAASNIQSLASPINLGALNNLAPPNLNRFRIQDFTFSPVVADDLQTVIVLDGSEDIVDIPTTAATALVTTSGHTTTIAGNPSPLVYSTDELTVPELWHEDLVKFCLAQAHNKNQNYRGADADMEAYQQNLAMRRQEADTADTPQYVVADPSDYDYLNTGYTL